MKQITARELKQLIDNQTDFQLIDVREQYEFDEANLKGQLIPMGDVLSQVDKISRDKQVVVHCRSGARSASVINALESQHGLTNLYNLQGGILAYINEFGI